MKKRSECKCVCHEPGYTALHIRPCCTPDEYFIIDNPALNHVERCTILAALLYYRTYKGEYAGYDPDCSSLAKDGGKITELTSGQIDDLIARLKL